MTTAVIRCSNETLVVLSKNRHLFTLSFQVESITRLLPLPSSMSNWIRCLYGGQFPDAAECSSNGAAQPVLCKVASFTQRDCHLQLHNIYTFDIRVDVRSDKDKFSIHLDVGQAYQVCLSDTICTYGAQAANVSRGSDRLRGVVTGLQPGPPIFREPPFPKSEKSVICEQNTIRC